MKAKKVTRYYADHCGRGFWKKAAAIHHEEVCKCWINPKCKTCKTCKHGDFQPYESDTGQEAFWECSHEGNDRDAHAGAPHGLTYISVNCELHEIDV
jgi:hypothetical protein